MAGFSIRALADGEITYLGDSKYRINVTSLSVFALDKFEFTTMTKILGMWNCEKKEVGLALEEGAIIADGSFNRFRDKFGYGGDFLTLSNLHKVENFTGLEYVYLHKHD